MTKKQKTIAIILGAIFSIGSTFALARLLKKDDEPKTEEPQQITTAGIDLSYFENESNYKLLKLHEAKTMNFSKGGFYIRCYGQGQMKFGVVGSEEKFIICAAHDDVYDNQITDGTYTERYEFASSQYYNRVEVYGERPAYEGTRSAEDKTETEGVTLYYTSYTDYYIPKWDEMAFKDSSGATVSLEMILGVTMEPESCIDAYILWPKG